MLSFGAVAGGASSMVYLLYQYKKTGGIKARKRSDSIVMGNLLRIAIPISLGATVGTVMSLIDSVLVPQKLLQAGFTYREAAILYGQLTGKAFVLINVPLNPIYLTLYFYCSNHCRGFYIKQKRWGI